MAFLPVIFQAGGLFFGSGIRWSTVEGTVNAGTILALVLNPDLNFADLNYDRASFIEKPALLRPLLKPLIRNLSFNLLAELSV